MGLDVTYYSNIKQSAILKSDEDDEDDEDDIYNHDVYVHDIGFYYQLGSLKKFTAYDRTPESEVGYICVGYSTYNTWRRNLAILAGYKDDDEVWNDPDFDPRTTKFYNSRYLKLKRLKDDKFEIKLLKPFYEIINFSDCEGAIGPEISKKLYKDFVDFEKLAKKQDDYFYKKYKEFKEAFRVASKNGAVVYH